MVSSIRVEHGDSREVIRTLADASIDSVVTDPPYGIKFMAKAWDHGGEAFDPAFWAEVLRVLKPGGHLVAFGGTRTYHRLACAIEDGGFEIRDQIGWAFGSGFPKSHDVSKGIDKATGIAREDKFEGSFERRAGPTGNKKCDVCGKWLISGSPCQCPRPQDAPISAAARQWQGWGTALKPAWEPICLARKPLSGTVAQTVLAHGTGALNIDGCRVGDGAKKWETPRGGIWSTDAEAKGALVDNPLGRWPANLIHDGSEEVLAAFPDSKSCNSPSNADCEGKILGGSRTQGAIYPGQDGTAARFFYTAKADAGDRLSSRHPTVKPVDLMAYLCRLVTPPGGTVLDPFAGSGSTGMAAMREGFDCIMIEREAEYVADIRYRLEHVDGSDTPLFTAPPMAPDQPAQLSLLDPYDDGWLDAAANSKGCYDVAIAAMREQFVRDQTE